MSDYLKKPLSYFYPPYARENVRPEEMEPLVHELQMHFMDIGADELKKLVIQIVKVFAKYNPVDLVKELLHYMKMKELEEKQLRRKARKELFEKGKK